jgi:enoyl-CoA hydratase/carnithine racemase
MSVRPANKRSRSVLDVDDIADRVRLLTLRRPEAANAFNAELYFAAAGALHDAATNDAVSVVVVTGEGKAFSAGVDLVEMAALVAGDGPAGERDIGRGFSAFLDALVEFPKPLIAAVNGAAVGIGFTMLLHCDLVLVSDAARFKAPFTEMGVAPEAASSYLLPLRLGSQQATRALLSSQWVTATEAVEHGLALKVCAPNDLVGDAVALAADIAKHALPSLMATKRLVRDPERDAIRRARTQEDAAFAELLARPGAHDAVLGQLP